MRVLAIHSRYRIAGGEDVSFDSDVAYLRERGDQVAVLEVDSAEYANRGLQAQVATLLGRDRSLEDQLLTTVRELEPEVAYLNNWFPWLAPLLGRVNHRMPVLATVPNYRLWCLNGLFFRSGRTCRSCLEGGRLNGVIHGCYRGLAGSAAALALVHRGSSALMQTQSVHFAPVSTFVAGFLKDSGVAESRIHVKPNMVFPVPSVGPGGESVLFVGRLEPEKGFGTFLSACELAGVTPVVAGLGSLVERARASSDYRGAVGPTEALELMGRSLVTVAPSIWDEPFGRVAAESLGCGTPVIVTARGGLQSVGDAGCSITTVPGDAGSLAAAIRRVRSDPYWSGAGRGAARERFMTHFTPQAVGGLLQKALRAAAAEGPVSY